MKNQFYISGLFLLFSMPNFFWQGLEKAQTVLGIESTYSEKSNENIVYENSVVGCLADTLFYAEAKSTGFQVLSVNNATSAQQVGQRFEAPQSITISGVVFHGWSSSLPSVNVDVSVYLAGVDDLPTGMALAATTFALDDNDGGGNIELLRREVTFPIPITVNQDYIVVVSNLSGNGINLVCNSYSSGDGDGEDLSSVDLFGTWQKGSTITIGGTAFDADWFFEPVVTYDLISNYSIAAACLPATVNFTNTSSPVLEHKMYSLNAFNGTPELNFEWTFGDGSPMENVVDASHAFSGVGPYTVTLNNTMTGWALATPCTIDTMATLGAPITDICTSLSTTVPPGGGWTDINDGSGNTIVSINAPAGVNLGTVTVEVLIRSSITTVTTANGDVIKLVPRTFHLSSSNYAANANFPSNVDVRFYFADLELTNMNAANLGDNGVTSHLFGDLEITHYNGANQDCDLSNNDYSTNTSILSSPVVAVQSCSGHSLEMSVSHFSEFTPHEPAPILPIELIDFTAKVVNEKFVRLDWQTATEINNSGFEIERSKSGQNWQKIGFVEGLGHSSERQDYTFDDNSPFTGANYYRLKQVDFDDSYEYSEVVHAKIDPSNDNSFTIHPNPSTGGQISLVFKNLTIGTLNIYNAQGKLISQQLIESTQQNHEISLPELGQGTYIAEFFTENEKLVRRFIVQ